ncbi:hypothetical protein KEJ26_05900 [Candidatus Bathyarchaeota archaeon]|nr:hypothetical protein [Candidatus Bathyarchaeota archaeon]
MLGKYDRFPATILHCSALLSHKNPIAKLQLLLIRSLKALNDKINKYSASVTDYLGKFEGEISFEVGIAEGIYFNYLDEEEVKRLSEWVSSHGVFSSLDMILIIRYHYVRGKKRVPLRADRYLLRFILHTSRIELYLFHEGGIMRITPEEVLAFIVDHINHYAQLEGLEKLHLEYIQTR